MTHPFRLAALTAVAVLLAASPAAAGPDAARFRTDADAFIRRAMEQVGVVPGLSIAVVDGEEVVLAAGYGLADLETRAPVDADTGFYIASSTKSFTALAVAAMAERGEIDLEAPLATWSTAPGLPADLAARVSLADLLSHRSGLDNSPMSFRAAMSGEHTPEVMQRLIAATVARDDMARWLEIQINDGVLDGRRIFPAGLVASTHRPLATNDAAFGPYVRESYGLGWQIGRYGDDVLIHHFGNFAGSRAHVSFMPERRLGVVVMVNEDAIAGGLADLVANYVYDWHAGRPDLEAAYDTALAGLVANRDRARASIAGQQADRATRPWMLARPLSAYVGIYENPVMGTVRVAERDGALVVSVGVMEAVAEPFTRPESLRVELAPLQGQVILFATEGATPDSLVFLGETFERR